VRSSLSLSLSLSLFLALGVGCASHQKKFRSEAERALLFPNGTYHHSISVQGGDEKAREFKGIIRVSDETILVVGLSHMQTTVFRIKEDRASGKVSTEIFHDSLQKFGDKLREIYTVLREMKLVVFDGLKEKRWKVIQMNENRVPLEIEGHGVRISFFDLDLNTVPSRIEIKHEKYTINVLVTGYDA
jgi:hypothetical protein